METVKVVLFDLWRTLVNSHCKEPVWDLQQILGHGASATDAGDLSPDDAFLQFCLTTNVHEPADFMRLAADAFGCQVGAEALDQFLAVLAAEADCVAMYQDVRKTVPALRERGYRIGLVSNLWPFPTERIFGDEELADFFPSTGRIYSYEVGHRKPDNEIFLEAANRFQVHPSECLMVGDNLQADCLGAIEAGMRAALINRGGYYYREDDVPGGILHLKRLHDLLEHLPSRTG